MPRLSITLMGICLVAAIVGCRPAAQSPDLADVGPILRTDTAWTAHPIARSSPRPEHPAGNGQVVHVQARFIGAALVSELKAAGLSLEGDHQVIPRADFEKRFTKLTKRGNQLLRVLRSPQLTLTPREESTLSVLTDRAFVHDYEYQPPVNGKKPPQENLWANDGWGRFPSV